MTNQMAKDIDLESKFIIDTSQTLRQHSTNETCFKSLSLKERVSAFVFFNILAYVLQMESIFKFFTSIAIGDTSSFAYLYSFGNILSIIGTLFIVGVNEQIAIATNPTRKMCSIVYFASILLTLLFASVLSGVVGKVLTTGAVGVQMVSYWWYLFSYIPGARNFLCGCFSCFFKFKGK